MIWNWTLGTDISIVAIIGWIIPFVMLFIVPVNRKPSSATAWLLLIYLLPYAGLIIFLLIGSPKLSSRRRAQQRTMDILISKAIADAEQQPELKMLLQPVVPSRYEPFVTLNTNLGFLPAFGGNAAKHKLVITNPYFVPDDALMLAITNAALRGVDVTLLNSTVSDQFFVSHAERSYYEDLLNAGVQIYHYNAPILLHSKLISVDDDIAVIGSSNLDIRSFQLNLEVTLVCYDTGVVADLRKIEIAYLQNSKQVFFDKWKTRNVKEKLFENISRLTAALQ